MRRGPRLARVVREVEEKYGHGLRPQGRKRLGLAERLDAAGDREAASVIAGDTAHAPARKREDGVVRLADGDDARDGRVDTRADVDRRREGVAVPDPQGALDRLRETDGGERDRDACEREREGAQGGDATEAPHRTNGKRATVAVNHALAGSPGRGMSTLFG